MTALATAVACNVCGAASGPPIYRSGEGGSITSLAKPFAGETVVFACSACAHVQTPPLADIASYYDTNYNVRAEDEDADDLYAVRDGVAVYRTEHQAGEALEKLSLAPGARVLDYGCGKARTLRHMVRMRGDLRPSVFDVSDAYRRFWDEFVPRDEQAAYSVPEAWEGRFDAVLSFYAMEHVADPRAFLRAIRAVLRPGGRAHVVVPNVRRNAGDLIVVDHVNHFMPTSLRLIFALEGFDEITIDEESNTAAYVINARAATPPSQAEHHPNTPDVRPSHGEPQPSQAEPHPKSPDAGLRHPELVEGCAPIAAVESFLEEARAMARFWSGARERIAAFEQTVRGRKAAIYGSGFYGAFIASALADRDMIAYFLDRNPHQQAKRVFDRAVIAPDAIGDDVEVVYAGLNPASARTIVDGVEALRRRPRELFFL